MSPIEVKSFNQNKISSLVNIGEEQHCPVSTDCPGIVTTHLFNFPGFEIEILSELSLALMTGDHWGLTLVTGGVQLNSIVRSHSQKPHWRVIRDLYIINSSQFVQLLGLFTFLQEFAFSISIR